MKFDWISSNSTENVIHKFDKTGPIRLSGIASFLEKAILLIQLLDFFSKIN
jgi:hypothetical protein